MNNRLEKAQNFLLSVIILFFSISCWATDQIEQTGSWVILAHNKFELSIGNKKPGLITKISVKSFPNSNGILVYISAKNDGGFSKKIIEKYNLEKIMCSLTLDPKMIYFDLDNAKSSDDFLNDIQINDRTLSLSLKSSLQEFANLILNNGNNIKAPVISPSNDIVDNRQVNGCDLREKLERIFSSFHSSNFGNCLDHEQASDAKRNATEMKLKEFEKTKIKLISEILLKAISDLEMLSNLISHCFNYGEHIDLRDAILLLKKKGYAVENMIDIYEKNWELNMDSQRYFQGW